MQNDNNLLGKAGSDYLITPGLGAHKLHVRKLPWNKARRICIQEGGKFLIAILFDSSKCSLSHHSLRAIIFHCESSLLNFLLYQEHNEIRNVQKLTGKSRLRFRVADGRFPNSIVHYKRVKKEQEKSVNLIGLTRVCLSTQVIWLSLIPIRRKKY